MGRTTRYLSVLGGLALWAGPLCVMGQDYIDLEAERAQPGQQPGRKQEQEALSPEYPGPMDDAAAREAPGGIGPDNVGELFYRLQLLQQEVMELRGRVEEQAYQIRQLKEQSLERYIDLDRRLKEGMAGETSPGAQPGGDQTTPQELAGEADAYRAAYSLVRSQQFSDAVTAFKQFLVDYPSGRYVPNAHYWLGELYLVKVPPDDESARREFNRLLEDYPRNNKIPDALYKLGKIYFDRGDRDRAREYFDRVINEFGDSGSSAIKLAQDFVNSNY